MDNLAAILVAAALFAVFALLAWGMARGWRRLLGDDPARAGAVTRCASCAAKPVCESGALAGWLGNPLEACPNVERLRRGPLPLT